MNSFDYKNIFLKLFVIINTHTVSVCLLEKNCNKYYFQHNKT